MSLEEALRRARERGSAAAAKILAQDDMLDIGAFSQRTGMTAQDIYERAQRAEILLLQVEDCARFPVWQLNSRGKVWPAIGALLKLYPGQPWCAHRFLIQYHPELEKTGLAAILSGSDEAVLKVAQGISESNFS